MKHVRRADGGDAILDEMSTVARAWACLVEHANERRAAGFRDVNGGVIACPCGECARHRQSIRCYAGPNGEMIVVSA